MKIRFSLLLLTILATSYFSFSQIQRVQIPQERMVGRAPVVNSLSGTSATPNAATPNTTAPLRSVSGYDTVPNDPFGTRIYKLRNGLTVYLSDNKNAPRIQTLIAVKAGSKFDPRETTGLAHYLEHMVFKGSDKYGTKNWPLEKLNLDSVQALFEEHLKEKDEARKTKIYARIDSFSYEASKYAVPNEYDKMTNSIGAQGTNAFTSTDMTVYQNDIPSSSLDKFLALESERFRKVVLRLFHTELETVYEEFNRNQDNDRVWSDHNLDNALMPNHPYGTQTTIGEGEHLKNPSMINIYNYFNTYYRPNNVAVILVGDIDFDKTIEMVNKYFGSWEARDISPFQAKEQPKIEKPIEREYSGPMPEHVYVGFRFNGANTKEAMMVKMVDQILANGEAGLIDLDLVQQQKVLQAYSFVDENTDFCIHKFYGEPKAGQKLQEVRDLLLAEIEKIKKGDFGDWLLPAIIQNQKLQRMKDAETNDRAYIMMGAFVHNIAWNQWVNEIDEESKVTKADIVKFVNEHYGNNYAVSYKTNGDAKVHKVEKPKITSVVMNKEDESDYKKAWDAKPETPITPRFLDFDKDITHRKLNESVAFDYVRNDVNKTFSLNYIFDMGNDNIRELGLAVQYLEFLGTAKYTPEQLKIEFYKLGLNFSVNTARDRVYISLSGLEDNLDKGLELFEHVLANVKPDKEAYDAMVGDIIQKRMNAKKNKGAILYSGLLSTAKYGEKNPFNNVMSEDELQKTDVNKLIGLIQSLSSYKHKIFYYGSKSVDAAIASVKKFHTIKSPLKDYPAPVVYKEQPTDKPVVYVCYYPMKQAEIIMLSKDEAFNAQLYPALYMYNEYYGSGLSSIMFQEIREKMALAYSVYSNFGVPAKKDESHYLTSYVGTQADKMETALAEMSKLLGKMPQVPQQFEGARSSLIKTLQTDWVTREGIYWAYDRATKRGINYDARKQVFEAAKTMTMNDLDEFFKKHIAGKTFEYCVIGKKEDLNMDVLKKLGEVKELSLQQVFGY